MRGLIMVVAIIVFAFAGAMAEPMSVLPADLEGKWVVKLEDTRTYRHKTPYTPSDTKDMPAVYSLVLTTLGGDFLYIDGKIPIGRSIYKDKDGGYWMDYDYTCNYANAKAAISKNRKLFFEAPQTVEHLSRNIQSECRAICGISDDAGTLMCSIEGKTIEFHKQ